MKSNHKRILALLMAFALILQYSFSASFLSVYAEGEGAQTEVTQSEAKAAAEPAPAPEPEPAPAAEEASEPAPEPEPAPAAEEASEPEPAPAAAEESPAAPEEAVDTAEDEQAAEGSSDSETSEAVTEEQTEGSEADAAEEETLPEEEAAEEEEEEVKYPADTFKGSAGGVSVVINAPEGALPEGTKLTVTAVPAGEVQDAVEGAIGGEASSIKAVDITFSYKGKEIEPKKAVKVHMNASGMANEANQSVVHIADNGAASVVTEAVSNGNATFNSKDFSIYIVVEEDEQSQDENAVATYEFYVGDELKETQHIKSGDTLMDPGALAGDGANTIFKGWYVEEGQDIEGETPGAKLTFGAKSSVPKTETIKIKAKVETTYYVTFWGEPDADGNRGIHSVESVTVEGDPGTEGTLDFSGKTVIPKADTSAFEGWSETEGGEVLENTTITVTKSTDLYAVIVDANWIHFDENVDYETSDSDPTYTGPVFVKKTDDLSTKKPADPTRPGYTFGGWYEEAGCTTEFKWTGKGLDEDITLYAKWIPGKAKYTVIIWKQKVTDAVNAENDAKTYDFEASEVKTGTTGETLNESDFTSYTEFNYTGFHYGDRIKIEPATVRADGTTVVNVYYDRDVLKIVLRDGGTVPEYVETTSTGGEQQYGKIGDDYIALTRRGTYGNRYWTYSKTGTYSGTTYRQAAGTGGTQYGFSDGQMVQITYVSGGGCGGSYWTLPDGTAYTGTRYVEGATGGSGYGVMDGQVVDINQEGGEWVYNENVRYEDTRYVIENVPAPAHEFTGLYGSTLESNGYTWPTDRDWYQNPNAGGTRLTFLDAFKFNGLSGVSEDGLTLTQYGATPYGDTRIRFYKQNIDGTWPTNATNTVSVSSNSTFTITEKYEGFTAIQYRNGGGNWINGGAGTSRISANNLQIRFQRNKYDLTFISEGSTVETVKDIPYEDVMSKYRISNPTKEHYNFMGWCEDPEGVALFDWNSKMPAANKVLYAKWEPKQYHVSLDPNGGELVGTQDAEFNVWLDTVLSKDSLFQNVKYDDKHELVGWFYKTGPKAGSVYDYGKIEEDVSLIAKWRMPGQVSVVYDAGEGGSNPPTVSYKYATDSSVVLGAPPTTIKDKYVFVGWQLKDKDGNLLDTVYYTNNTFDITENLIADYDESTKTGTVYIVAKYNKTGEGPYASTSITYNANGGEGDDVVVDKSPSDPTKDLLVNEKVTAKSDSECSFTRDGYDFDGWNTEADGTGLGVAAGETIAADLFDRDKNSDANILYAQWTLKKYTVVYTDGVDGEVFADETHNNLTVEKTTPQFNDGTDPEREGYDFTGWDPAYTEELNVDAADDDNVITYTAKWEEKKVTIKYEATTGGSVDPPEETVKVVTGKITGSTATAEKGYEFVNWTDKDGKVVSTDEKYVPTEKVAATYTANFKQATTGYVVHHYLKGTEINVAEDDTGAAVIGSEFTASAATEFFKKFDGYELNAGELKTITIDADSTKNVIDVYYTLPLTIEAKTDSKTYDGEALSGEYTISGYLTKDVEDSARDDEEKIKEALGEAPSIINVSESPKDYLTKADQEEVTGKIPEYYDPKYTQGTLTIEPVEVTVETGSAEKVYDGTPLTNEAASITGLLDADAETVKVTATGSQTEVGSSDNTYSIEWGDVDKNNYKVTEKLGTLTVTAVEPETADITYNLNGGEYNGSTADIVETYDVGEVIKIHAAPTRDGYVFVEWRGSSYQPGDSYTVEGDHTFTAIWEAETKPDDEDTPDDGDKTDSSKGVKTGDAANLLGWMILAIIAEAGMVFMVRRREND